MITMSLGVAAMKHHPPVHYWLYIYHRMLIVKYYGVDIV